MITVKNNIEKISLILKEVGFTDDLPENYISKNITLRDGRNAIMWENKYSGHGILDSDFWEKEEIYTEEYRKKYSAILGKKTSSEDHFKIYKNLNKKQFDQFSDKLKSSTKYLEIGCSFGGIISHLINSNIKSISAIEPNIEDFIFVKNKNKNVIMYNDFFENIEFQEKYDIITSFEVLEHVKNPIKFVEKISKILSKDGFINIEVPNHNDALLKHYKNKEYNNFYYHKAHIHYFTPESLFNIFNKFGIKGKIKSFQMYPMFNQIYWHYNNKPQNSAVDALSWKKLNTNTDESEKINNFFDKMHNEYNELIENLLIGDCLIFQGGF